MSNVYNMPMVISSSFKKLFTAIKLGIITSAMVSSSVKADDKEWWFDIEVIIFKRDLTKQPVAETFSQSPLLPASKDNIDLISPYLTPDISYMRGGLPYCRASTLLAQQEKHDKDFAFPEPVVEEALDINEQAGESAEQVTELSPQDLAAETQPFEAEQPTQFETEKSNLPVEENFEYQVATTDIFGDQDNTDVIANLADESHQSHEASPIEEQELSTEPQPVELLPITIDWIEWQIPKQFPCVYIEQIQPSFEHLLHTDETEEPQDPLAQIQQVPTTINGIEWLDKSKAPFLLPKDQLRMTDLYTSIKKQRDISPLLHLAWRQEVTFGADNAQGYRLFAGENFAEQFNSKGEAKINSKVQDKIEKSDEHEEVYIPIEEKQRLTPEELQSLISQLTPIKTETEKVEESLFNKIEQALQSDTIINTQITDENQTVQSKLIDEIKQLWHVDGFMKVYLQNVGRVPYLHIDSHLDYRYVNDSPLMSEQLDTNDSLHKQSTELQSVRFDQLRRVISKQVHYFDHPLFGMVVTINRFNWPIETETSLEH